MTIEHKIKKIADNKESSGELCPRFSYGSRAEIEFGVARLPLLRYESNFRTALTQLVRDEMKIQAVEANEMRISNPSSLIC